MLTQAEADALIALPKKGESNDVYTFPLPGETLSIPIVSQDTREEFMIGINRGRIRLAKCSYQERHNGIIILIRLDVDGPPHTNPKVRSIPLSYLTSYNGQTIDCPHLHSYVDGFMDKWAVPVPADKFIDTTDLYTTLQDFFYYCNVTELPVIQRRLSI